MTALANLLNTGHLHENTRARGSAYGAGVRIRSSGLLATYNYRDPQLQEAIVCYDTMGTHLGQPDLGLEEISQIIIGSINILNPLRTPYKAGQIDLARSILGQEEEDLSIQKQKALTTSFQSLKPYQAVLNQAMNQDQLVALESQDMIEENEDLFDQVYSI